MAEFTPNKIDLEQINGGKKYKNGDGLQPETINALVEGLAFVGSGGSANFEYVTTARLKYFEYGNEETYNYKNFDYESITAGKYLVLGDITVNFNYYYEGYGMQPSIAKGAVTTVVDLSPNSGETVTMEFRMPCNWEYDDETFEYSILPIFINMLNGGTDIAFGGGWDDLVDYDCTLTFIKIG